MTAGPPSGFLFLSSQRNNDDGAHLPPRARRRDVYREKDKGRERGDTRAAALSQTMQELALARHGSRQRSTPIQDIISTGQSVVASLLDALLKA